MTIISVIYNKKSAWVLWYNVSANTIAHSC